MVRSHSLDDGVGGGCRQRQHQQRQQWQAAPVATPSITIRDGRSSGGDGVVVAAGGGGGGHRLVVQLVDLGLCVEAWPLK